MCVYVWGVVSMYVYECVYVSVCVCVCVWQAPLPAPSTTSATPRLSTRVEHSHRDLQQACPSDGYLISTPTAGLAEFQGSRTILLRCPFNTASSGPPLSEVVITH